MHNWNWNWNTNAPTPVWTANRANEKLQLAADLQLSYTSDMLSSICISIVANTYMLHL